MKNDLRLPKLLVQWRVANLQSLTVAGAAQALFYDKNLKTHLFPSFTELLKSKVGTYQLVAIIFEFGRAIYLIFFAFD